MSGTDARVIDLTPKAWGRDYTFRPIDGGKLGKVMGWSTPLPRVGDYLLLRNDGGSTRYRVTAVSPCWDPPDMFSADVEFAPRAALTPSIPSGSPDGGTR